MKFFSRKLKNGLTVVEVPSGDAESVVLDVFVKTGSRSEAPKEAGISHFLEHFLFKGTERYPSALEISRLVDAIGGDMNANTGKEHTQYYIKAACRHLPLIFDVLTDMVQRPLLDQAELEREKGVIVEEINMYRDTPMYEVESVLDRTMWPKSSLGRDTLGTKETVTAFTPTMFRRYIAEHYQPGNMIVGISGKYDRAAFSKLLTARWSRLPNRPFGRWSKVTANQRQPRLTLEYKDTEQAHLALGFRAYPYGDRRAPALSVLAAILGGGMSSRLFSEVRQKRGLAYYIHCSPSSFQDTGSFTVGSGVQVAKLGEALKVISSELKLIKNQPVGEQELQKAKEYIKGKTTLALEDNQMRLDWFLERTAFLKEVLTPKQAFARIDAVSATDVRRAAREVFQNRQMSLAVIGPYRSEAAIRRALSVD